MRDGSAFSSDWPWSPRGPRRQRRRSIAPKVYPPLAPREPEREIESATDGVLSPRPAPSRLARRRGEHRRRIQMSVRRVVIAAVFVAAGASVAAAQDLAITNARIVV